MRNAALCAAEGDGAFPGDHAKTRDHTDPGRLLYDPEKHTITVTPSLPSGPTCREPGVGNIQIIGSPETVVDPPADLKRAGCDGIQVAFFDFAPDLEIFGEAVLPLMRQPNLRDDWQRGTSPRSVPAVKLCVNQMDAAPADQSVTTAVSSTSSSYTGGS